MNTPIDRHERVALHFSGGKDSLAVVYILRPYWDKLTIYHVDTGDLLPEVREIVAMVEKMVPKFQRIQTNAVEWTARIGMPSDLVPTTSTFVGLSLGMSKRRIVDRFVCCGENIMLPMHNRMLDDGITLAIRGTKRADAVRLPAESGHTAGGYELWLPLQDWSHEQVFAYLREIEAPICRVYEHRVNAPECATCTAWWGEGRAEYLRKYHPELYAKYRNNLLAVNAEIVPHLQTLQGELK